MSTPIAHLRALIGATNGTGRSLIERLPQGASKHVRQLVEDYRDHPIAQGPLGKIDDAVWRFVVTHRPAHSPQPTATGDSPAASQRLTPLNAPSVSDAVFSTIHWVAQPAAVVTAGCTWVALQGILGAQARRKHTQPRWWAWGITPAQTAATIAIIVSAQASSTGLKKLISRDRPPEMFRLAVENAHSFPSGHMIASVTACGVLSALWAASAHASTHGAHTGPQGLKKAATGPEIPAWVPATMAAWCALVGYDRLYMGVHWLSDLIGGAGVGLFWSTVAWKVLPALGPARS